MSLAAVINSWLALLRVVPFEGGEQPIGDIGGPGGAGGQKELDDPPLGLATSLSEMGHPTANAQPAKDFRRAASASNPRTEGNGRVVALEQKTGISP